MPAELSIPPLGVYGLAKGVPALTGQAGSRRANPPDQEPGELEQRSRKRWKGDRYRRASPLD